METAVPLLTCKGSQVQVLVRPPNILQSFKASLPIRDAQSFLLGERSDTAPNVRGGRFKSLLLRH